MTSSSNQIDGAQEHQTLVLTQDPFCNRSNQALSSLYPSIYSSQLLGRIKHFLDKTQYALVISGPSGSGKSVLVHQFIVSLDRHYIALNLDASNGLNAVELLSLVADTYTNKRKKALELEEIFRAQISKGKTPVLLIDNADLLDKRTLQLCFKLNSHGLRLILAADTEIEARISQILAPLAEGALQVQEAQVERIKPMEIHHTGCFLRHQLAYAGYGGPLPFTDEELLKIHQESQGFPGGINTAARKILKEGPKRAATHNRHKPAGGGASSRIVITGLLLTLLAGLALIFIFKDQINLAQQTLPSQPAKVNQVMDETGAFTADSAPLAPPLKAISQPETLHVETTPNPESDIPLQNPIATAPSVKAPQEPLTHVASKPLTDPTEVETLPSSAITEDEPKIEPERTATPVVATTFEPVKVDEATVSNLKTEPEITTTTPPVKPAPEARNLAQPTPSILTTEDYLALNPRHYTMQVIAGRKLKAILDFIEKNNIQADSAWYEIQRKDKPWYSLTYKVFSSRQAALDALDSIPKAIQSRKPWIRRLSAIQKSIRESAKAAP